MSRELACTLGGYACMFVAIVLAGLSRGRMNGQLLLGVLLMVAGMALAFAAERIGGRRTAMIKDPRLTRAQILATRQRVTELLVELDADTVEQTPESQAWAALADAYQNLTTALAFVDAAGRPEPTAQELGGHGLRLVR